MYIWPAIYSYVLSLKLRFLWNPQKCMSTNFNEFTVLFVTCREYWITLQCVYIYMYIITMYMYILKSIPIFRTEIKLLKPLDKCAKDIGPTMKNYSISNVKNCFCIYNVHMIFFFQWCDVPISNYDFCGLHITNGGRGLKTNHFNNN